MNPPESSDSQSRRRTKQRVQFSADRPILRVTEDKLGRGDFARNLAANIRGWSGRESLVVALCGEWGCGKTSLKNMVVEHLNKGRRNKMTVLEFNPWEISGHSDITSAFLNDLARALPQNVPDAALELMRNTSRNIGRYAERVALGARLVKLIGKGLSYVAPVSGGAIAAAGEVIETAATATTETAKAAQETVEDIQPTLSELKTDIVRDMGKLRTPILAVIDDIDRLTTDEIRQVFQLVKANANFPNLIFLLMFDRVIVGKALDGVSDGRGDEFLEKIVQVPFDVPEASTRSITKALFAPLDSFLEDPAVKRHWNLVFRLRRNVRTDLMN